MSRPAAHRWQVVGESSDPVPGDPEEVARLGRELRRTADAIDKQAKELRALESVENWVGKTADSFREEADGAADKLSKAFRRYDEAAKALGTSVEEECGKEYASELHRAQRIADKALVDAEGADGERRSAQRSLDAQPDDTPDDDPDRKRLSKQSESAGDAIQAAEKSVATAKAVRDKAAKAAAEAIRDVIDDDGLKDGWKDKFKNWVDENSGWLKEISKWAGRIALWAGVAALALGWIPVVGQALAAVATAVALVASVVALATDLVLALGGQGSWKAVMLDAVGVATFGVGRAAIAGARGASAGGRAVARSNLYKAARDAGKNQNKAWKIANRGSQGTIRGKKAAEAMAGMPKARLPGWRQLGEGFGPKAVYRDTVDGVKTVKNGMPGLRAPGGPTMLDPDLARAGDGLRNISPAAQSMPEVQGAASNFSGNAAVWTGSTATGVAAGSEGAYGAVSGGYNTVTGG